ncbi:transporter substrate-binding domain-containing protein [Brucella pseudogrignonensis]|uniref:transporter substrate-binding domain-containing protein n=1 Tax=Brucella pseudogrignonensis TaxID=419475 RepID=UPI000CFC2779|nr:transporter substrate-binding domain-containing protein [Brucella pseudogrignonensis]MQP41376.1 transporter substrate-binding domain-containing protein [Ochrobactrum sp. MYb237]PQZ41321.1 amino acid ABC transporter substrate-binding protein [Brucella pseudogrignonensis]PRA39899.1 amino acid ABC transporter substrate-binding protein [Brucella pseudogrignonensis]PRA66332.1 amino acid ABC transporter substrate-binding protein [Brucella pseudogrignonensis]
MVGFKGKIAGAIALAVLASGAAQAEGKLRLGMTPEPYMPFTQVNAAGEWEGLEADLSRALCEKLADKCEFKSMAWDGLIPSLTENKVDFIIGAFSVTDERRKVVDFSTPYYTEGTVVVGSKSDTDKVGTVAASDGSGEVVDQAALSGKIVGVQTSSVQSVYMTKYLPDVSIKSYDTADNSVADLVAGRVDYVLAPDLFVQNFLKTPQGEDYEVKLVAPKSVVLGEGVAYAVRKGDTATLEKVDAAIAELDKEGALKALVDKWIFEKK